MSWWIWSSGSAISRAAASCTSHRHWVSVCWESSEQPNKGQRCVCGGRLAFQWACMVRFLFSSSSWTFHSVSIVRAAKLWTDWQEREGREGGEEHFPQRGLPRESFIPFFLQPLSFFPSFFLCNSGSAVIVKERCTNTTTTRGHNKRKHLNRASNDQFKVSPATSIVP